MMCVHILAESEKPTPKYSIELSNVQNNIITREILSFLEGQVK